MNNGPLSWLSATYIHQQNKLLEETRILSISFSDFRCYQALVHLGLISTIGLADHIAVLVLSLSPPQTTPPATTPRGPACAYC